MNGPHHDTTQDAVSIQNVFDLLDHRTHDDAMVGISIATLIDDDAFYHHAAGLAPSEKITPHYHQHGHELYPIMQGKGLTHTWLSQGSNQSTQRVKRKTHVSVPASFVHQLENDSDDAPVPLFACSPSHLDQDRVL